MRSRKELKPAELISYLAGFYLLSEKIGKSMFDVHVPVPQFNEKLLVSVERCVLPLHYPLPHRRLTLFLL